MNNPPRPHILVVDDDARLRDLLKRYLYKHGFIVTCAQDAAQARRLLKGLEFDVIILDIMMPGEDGLSFCSAIRRQLETPILFLSAKSDAADRIHGLTAGADDYLSKPFEPQELHLRLLSILKRTQNLPSLQEAAPPQQLLIGDVSYHTQTGALTQSGGSHHGDTIRLTGAESQLLDIFSKHLSQTLTRHDLAHQLSHSGHSIQERAIDVHITRLRKKIEADPKNPKYLQTIRGEGYRLVTQKMS